MVNIRFRFKIQKTPGSETLLTRAYLSPEPQVAGDEELCPTAGVQLHEGDALVVTRSILSHTVPVQ